MSAKVLKHDPLTASEKDTGDWRNRLAEGHPAFRHAGTYDSVATGRALRRALARQARRAKR